MVFIQKNDAIVSVVFTCQLLYFFVHIKVAISISYTVPHLIVTGHISHARAQQLRSHGAWFLIVLFIILFRVGRVVRWYPFLITVSQLGKS